MEEMFGTLQWLEVTTRCQWKKYTSYYLMMCYSVPLNPIHLLNKLGQQWIVDQFFKIEMQILRWIRDNKKDYNLISTMVCMIIKAKEI